MRLIKPTYKIIEQEAGLNGIFKQIELAGRTCYKSEDKITENSSKEFVERMTKSGHGAMLEHGTVYLKFKTNEDVDNIYHYQRNKYSIINIDKTKLVEGSAFEEYYAYITTNYRVLVENK